MLTVYSGIEGIPTPEIDMDWEKSLQIENEYVERVCAFASKHGKGNYAGKEVSFPIADGYARYVILSINPCKLIHLAVGDAWSFPYIERLTSKDIVSRVRSIKKLHELFSLPE